MWQCDGDDDNDDGDDEDGKIPAILHLNKQRICYDFVCLNKRMYFICADFSFEMRSARLSFIVWLNPNHIKQVKNTMPNIKYRNRTIIKYIWR